MKQLVMLRWGVLIAAILVIGLVVTGGCLFGIGIATAHAVTEQREALVDFARYDASMQQLENDSRAVTARVPRRQAPWTWSDHLPVMVTQLSALLEKDGAKLETLQPVPVVERESLTRFPLRMTLHTDLATLTAVLKRLQQATPLLTVDQLSVRVGRVPGDPLTINLTLSSYVMLDNVRTGGRP